MEKEKINFRLLIVSATPFEIAPLMAFLKEEFNSEVDNVYTKGGLEVSILVTGVGIAYTSYFLGQFLRPGYYNLAVNAGLAGAFSRDLEIGTVVNVITERFADLGVEEADGTFTDVHQLGLIGTDQPPFQFGALHNPGAEDSTFLPTVNGITINKVHGYEPSIAAIQKKYGAEVESMEGAAFFQACLLSNQAFLEIRSISNYVEKRNREAWNLPLAIESLNGVLKELVGNFE